MFVDVVDIYIKAGNGGNGHVSFLREKYVPNGGPNGGDGGRGGNIVFVASDNTNTLSNFKYKKSFLAQNGEDGMNDKCHGRNGKDILIQVPVGTIVKDKLTGDVLFDMKKDDQVIAAKGGNGGFGNCHFATPTRQAPRFAKSGILTNGFELTLELKLIADIGLIGYPNVGKSTFLSVVTKARPKIANYHFTTNEPNLGVCDLSYGSMVIADIPGLIEGAAVGKGLGIEFLRHVERTRILFHIIDISASEGRDPVKDFEVINNEIHSYGNILSKKKQIIVANKIELLYDNERYLEFKEIFESRGFVVFGISNVTQIGIKELLEYTYTELQKIPLPEFKIVDGSYLNEIDDKINIEMIGNKFYITGILVDQIVNSVNINDYESLLFFQKSIKRLGIEERLKDYNIKNGDIVDVCGVEFEYSD